MGILPFCIDSTNKLRLCGPVDREQKSKYHLDLALVQDGITRSRSTATVTIENVNDNAPYIDPSIAVGYIPENSPSHTAIMKLQPVDNDLFPKQTVFQYKIADVRLAEIFSVNETTGILSTVDVLDREKRSFYAVPVIVRDRGTPPRSVTINLRIYVDDYDDNAPESEAREVNIEYYHGISRTIILHAVPVDLDAVGQYKCRLLNASEAYNVMVYSFVTYNGTSGIIIFQRLFDYAWIIS
ncbi:unnamed protein product [Gongylonema pulchrum]|uniref:CA domain-containing protein n=1 Tax=Gongylonema pulchrum TaxID=637853 RepID=A0A183EUY8_9BILA|nr:unnamed protein product [Gongylonema pulchrum]